MNKIYIVCWFNYGELNQQAKSELIKSIQRLYKMLPDATKVYPGHGKSTDIASEKKENTRIRTKTEAEELFFSISEMMFFSISGVKGHS